MREVVGDPSVTVELVDDVDGLDPHVSVINHLPRGRRSSTPAEILAAYLRCCPEEVYQQALAFFDEQMDLLIRGNE